MGGAKGQIPSHQTTVLQAPSKIHMLVKNTDGQDAVRTFEIEHHMAAGFHLQITGMREGENPFA